MINNNILNSTILKSIGDAVITTDIGGNITFINYIAEKLTKWQNSEAVGKPIEEIFKIINEHSREPVDNPVQKVIQEGTIVGLANHTILIAKDGSEIPIDDSGSPVRDEGDKIIGVVLIFRDITERKRLQEEQNKFFNLPLHLLIISDLDGIIKRVNPGWREKLGYDPEELVGTSFMQLVHPDDVEPTMVELEKLSKGITTLNFENRYKSKSGTYHTLAWSAIPRPKENLLYAIAHDITDRTKAEQELLKEKNLSQYIIDSNRDGIFAFDLNYHFTIWNPGMEKISGVKKNEVLNKHCFDVFPHFKETREDRYFYEALDGNYGVIEELQYTWPGTGKKGYIEGHYSPLKNEKGEILGGIFIVRNITERKMAENMLREAEKETRLAYNRAEFYKDLFAHDINNILQNLLSAIEINQERLQKLKDVKEIQEINFLMKEQVNRGAKLVSNIRKLTQIEEQKFEFQEVEGLSILKNSISFVEKSFRHRELNIHIDTHLEKFHLYANELLQEIYDNILINAVKYTQDDLVEIQIKIGKERKNGKTFIKLEFIDNGIGIQDDIKGKIFQRSFTEVRSVSGMGLGLSLVKMIVNTFKGEIWVENSIEDDYTKGSNFIVLLPEVVKK